MSLARRWFLIVCGAAAAAACITLFLMDLFGAAVLRNTNVGVAIFVAFLSSSLLYIRWDKIKTEEAASRTSPINALLTGAGVFLVTLIIYGLLGLAA